MSRRKAWMRRQTRGPATRWAAAIAVIAGALFFSTAAADPYGADGVLRARPPQAIGDFSVNGAPVTLIAYGKRATIIDSETAARIRESEHMSRAMPGYPQDAQITLAVRTPF
ncbi:MAG: hypothetical protein K2Q06_05280 [Parvularculaceae bacterium]|nr:hypothetical protein [Parvularculaceae bacterium]